MSKRHVHHIQINIYNTLVDKTQNFYNFVSFGITPIQIERICCLSMTTGLEVDSLLP